MAAIEVGVKVIFDKNGPLYIFISETKGFSKWKMVRNARISLITVSIKKRLESTTT